MTIRLYMAGPYSQRLVLKARAEELVRASGGAIEITASWLEGEHEAKEGNATLEEVAVWAYTDLSDIDSADVLIQFTEHPSTRGGAHTEFGYALARDIDDMQLVVCGPVVNIFHAHETVVRHPDWASTRSWLLGFVSGRSAA